jgi:pilus assembly protein CpaE
VSTEKISVKLEIKDTKLKSQFEKSLRKITGFNIQGRTAKERSDLLIFELGDDLENEFLLAQELLNSGEVGEVFFVSDHSDQSVLRRAIRTGAREFFSQPIEDDEINCGSKRRNFQGRKNL